VVLEPIPFVFIATLVLAHDLLDRKIVLQASAAAVLLVSSMANLSRLAATTAASTLAFWLAQTVFWGWR